MAHAPSTALSLRHQTLRLELVSRGLDALVITSLPNILYLTNFTGSSAILVVTADRLIFITDFRYLTVLDQARGTAEECPNLEVETVEGSYDATLADVIAPQPWRRIGFEAAHLTVDRYRWLKATMAVNGPREAELVATARLIERARVRKDPYEIAVLREAGRRLSAVAAAVPLEVVRGLSERDVALAIDRRVRQAGFERPAFDTIVASGPNAALPHARPGERTITEGDLVVLDFGGVYASYCVDLTRTVSVGAASVRAREVHSAVREAHDQAIAAVAPGRSRFDIDAAARDVLGRHGLAEAFGHGTGHGLGIEVHEDPRISRKRPDVDAEDEAVASGMIFTIEPGAYLAGWGGVRIEDDVLVTETGVAMLTDVTTDLIEV
jgi:Xaa-Pro aminopeptidase